MLAGTTRSAILTEHTVDRRTGTGLHTAPAVGRPYRGHLLPGCQARWTCAAAAA